VRTIDLISFDLVASVMATAAWTAAAILFPLVHTRSPSEDPNTAGHWRSPSAAVTGQRRAWVLYLILILGVTFVCLQVAAVALLAPRGWWFVQEKVLFAVPLAVVCCAAALVASHPVRRAAEHIVPVDRAPAAPTLMVTAALACGAGIVARLVVGYPFGWPAALTLLLLVLLGSWLAYSLFSPSAKRTVAGAAVLVLITLVASLGLAWLADLRRPDALATAHNHAAATDGTPEQALSALPSPASVPVTELRLPPDAAGPVRRFELTAREEQLVLDSGVTASAWTFGSVPGPEIRVSQGDLVEVRLRNRDVAAGVTLHWHGYAVPNGDDGVAGVTQDAVLPGEEFTYRFIATDAGTYWFHTHQASAEGVRRGLFGAFIVLPPEGIAETVDVTLPLHTLARTVLLGDSSRARSRVVAPGETVRLRLINTDQEPTRFRLAGASFRVVAADGHDLTGADEITGAALRVPAGGRLDLSLTMPGTAVLLATDSSSRTSLTLLPDKGAGSGGIMVDAAAADLDLLAYGAPAKSLPRGDGVVRSEMVLDRLPRFRGGVPRDSSTVNGAVFPHIPTLAVRAGNRVELTVVNRGYDTHPMHVHGHHVRVLSRDGRAATGSALELDTFDVRPGEVWTVAFIADNPGIWMDHCHNLDHAAEGMMMALAYRGISTPFSHGGEAGNRPE